MRRGDARSPTGSGLRSARLTVGEANPVTIAVGVATHPADARDKNALIAGADTALYYGKQSGGESSRPVREVPREMRDLRTTLDRLARAALHRPADAAAVEHARRAGRTAGLGIDDEASGALRDAVLGVARTLDEQDAASRAHADRVGRLAHAVAEQLGCPSHEADTVELAARLHGLEEDPSRAARRDPVPAWRKRDPSAERRLTGGSRRRGRGPISLGAEIVAAANMFDALSGGRSASRRSTDDALAELPTRTPSVRREVLDAVARVVARPAVRPITRGRRRADREAERGAA